MNVLVSLSVFLFPSLSNVKKLYNIGPRGQYYKTFRGCNLLKYLTRQETKRLFYTSWNLSVRQTTKKCVWKYVPSYFCFINGSKNNYKKKIKNLIWNFTLTLFRHEMAIFTMHVSNSALSIVNSFITSRITHLMTDNNCPPVLFNQLFFPFA
jgi:hypothetical protein